MGFSRGCSEGWILDRWRHTVARFAEERVNQARASPGEFHGGPPLCLEHRAPHGRQAVGPEAVHEAAQVPDWPVKLISGEAQFAEGYCRAVGPASTCAGVEEFGRNCRTGAESLFRIRAKSWFRHCFETGAEGIPLRAENGSAFKISFLLTWNRFGLYIPLLAIRP